MTLNVIGYLFILLFVYASVSKLLDFENFQLQLGQSPILSAYADFIAPSVILIELIIALLLIFEVTRLVGFYASFGLMCCFTVYIFLILNYSAFIPCSCGGILEKLGWTEHLIFNLIFVLLSLLGIVWMENHEAKSPWITLLKSSVSFSISIGLVLILFFSSEHIMKKENPFIRRFIPHAISLENEYDLKYNSYYFAGYDHGKIYLGNYTAPLNLTTIDTALRMEKSIQIELDKSHSSFRSLFVKVKAPNFYLYDGSVPVIYKGLLSGSTAQTISFDDAYFTQLEVIDSSRFLLNTQSSQNQSRTLGLLNLNSTLKIKLTDHLLKKQIDGIFDTDGILVGNPEDSVFVYVYYYRNEIPVFDTELNLLRRLHTIDTVSQAQIKVKKLSNGIIKMEAPPLKVNDKSILFNSILFNQSNLMGRFESKEVWKVSSIIDLYRITEQEYLGSLFIQHRGKEKMNQMMIVDGHLYILSGTEILRYRFAQSINQYFQKGEAENPYKE